MECQEERSQHKNKAKALAVLGARIRAGAELTRLDRGPQGALAMVTTTVEIEGVAKPACVSDSLFLLRPGKDAS